MTMRWIAVVALIFTLPLSAENVWLTPRILTTRTPITVHWEGTPTDLGSAYLTMRDNTVIVNTKDYGCVLAAPCVSGDAFELPALAAGDYQLVLKIDGDERLRRSFTVYDFATIPIYPPGAPADGRKHVLPGAVGRAALNLRFHGLPDGLASGDVVVPGSTFADVVDLEFSDLDPYDEYEVESGLARNAFVYVAGDACRDERLWESILIPVDYNGRGAFGSDWRTDVRIERDLNGRVAIVGPGRPCPFSSESFGLEGTRPNGYYLRIARSGTHLVSVSLQVRDVSEKGDNLPIELPVLRENEWLTSIHGTSIALPQPSPLRRLQLRLYVPDASVESFVLSGSEPFQQVALQDMGPDSPRFASVDISNFTGRISITPRRGKGVRDWQLRYWALVTATDNVTQQVFVYSAPRSTQ